MVLATSVVPEMCPHDIEIGSRTASSVGHATVRPTPRLSVAVSYILRSRTKGGSLHIQYPSIRDSHFVNPDCADTGVNQDMTD